MLRHFVHLASQCLRQQDVIGRLGGEEFAVVLPDTDAVAAALDKLVRSLGDDITRAKDRQGRESIRTAE